MSDQLICIILIIKQFFSLQSERAKVDDLRGTPMTVGSLEEMIDDNHAIVSSSMGPEYYVSIMSFVNKDLLEPGSSVLLHNKVFPSLAIQCHTQFNAIIIYFKNEKRLCLSWVYCPMMQTLWSA